MFFIMTDFSLEFENTELKEINLDSIEKKIELGENVGDLLLEMKKKRF